MLGTTDPEEARTDLAPESARSDGDRSRSRSLVIPLAATVIYGAYLFVVSYAKSWSIAGSYDLGYFRQAAWLIAHGEEPFVTVRGLHLLGDHASPAFYPIAWIAGHGFTIPILLALQSVGLALAILPLWGISRRHAQLTVSQSSVVVALYMLFPAVHNIALFDFHPEAVFGIPALIGAVYFALERRWVPYGLCVAGALACREDMSIPIAMLGVIVAISISRRAGFVTVAAGIAWFILATRVILPHFAGDFVQIDFLSQYGSTTFEVVKTFATDPGRVFDDLFTGTSWRYVVAMLLPVGFLSVLAPRWLLPGIPLVILYLLSSRVGAHNVLHQYTVVPTAFVFAALPFGFHRALKILRRISPSALIPVALAVGLVALGANGLYRDGRDSLRQRPGQWFIRDTVDTARLKAVERIPERASVSASVRIWPLIAGREDLYNFPYPWEGPHSPTDPETRRRRIATVDYVVLDQFDAEQWNGDLDAISNRLVRELGLRRIYSRNGIVVYRVPRTAK